MKLTSDLGQDTAEEELVCPLTPDNKYDENEDASGMAAHAGLASSRDYHFYCFFEVPPEAVLVGKSEFPLPIEDGYHFFTDEELRLSLSRQLDMMRGDIRAYSGDIRSLICAVSMELNFRQRWAPRFRGYPTLSSLPKSNAERSYLVDLQVLDLHWRVCSEYRPNGAIKGYPGLFNTKEWHVSSAVRFAEHELPFNSKVIDAKLAPSMLVEHACLQTTDLRDMWRTVRDGYVRGSTIERWGAPQLEARLREEMRSEPHLQRHVPGLVNTWMAYRLVGSRKPKAIARVLSLMTGEAPLDRSAINRKLESLEKRTGWKLD